ncbi:MAG: RraA family protein [Chloroflexota bacterium]|nr:MAG: RraA family protein [Chloroflexota bacterium]
MDWQKIKALTEFDTPTVANGLELLGTRDPSIGYCGPDVRALMPDMGVRVGIAVTARMDTTSAGMDNPKSLFKDWIRLMHEAAGKDGVPVIAVIESVGPRPRYTVTIGDGMGTIMRMAGAVGYVTNGSIRDIEGVRGVPLPCWAAGLSPMHGRIRWLDVGSPVMVDGVTVNPGDIIHADANGVLAIPRADADKVYEQAMIVRAKEAALFTRLGAPGMTIDRWLDE